MVMFTAVIYLFIFCFEIGWKERNKGREGRQEGANSRVLIEKICF